MLEGVMLRETPMDISLFHSTLDVLLCPNNQSLANAVMTVLYDYFRIKPEEE